MYFQHNPGAQLLFQIRSHQLSVFILQDRPGAVPLARGVVAQELAFNVETRSEGGLRYFVVSDASPADLQDRTNLIMAAR
jgi:hypothetical protein